MREGLLEFSLARECGMREKDSDGEGGEEKRAS